MAKIGRWAYPLPEVISLNQTVELAETGIRGSFSFEPEFIGSMKIFSKLFIIKLDQVTMRLELIYKDLQSPALTILAT